MLPNELGTSIQMTSGPALAKPADLLPFLTNLDEGSVLFIDEIHRMPRVVEEFIYPAMEDFRIDIVLGEGHERPHDLDAAEALHADRRDHPQRACSPARCATASRCTSTSSSTASRNWPQIVRVNAAKLQHADHRRRGARTGPPQPRHAAHRQRPALLGAQLRRQRSTTARITEEIARAALDMAEVDRDGLDKHDRRTWKR